MKSLRIFLATVAALATVSIADAQPSPQPGPWAQHGSSIVPMVDSLGVTMPSTVTGGNRGAGTINAAGLYVNGASVSGGASVSSVGLGLPTSVFSVTNSPITSSGTLTGSFINQSANTIFAGPTSGSAAAPAFRALVGADLPNPSASSLGGIQSATGSAHQWISSISTLGVPSLSQPGCGDLSDSTAACSTAIGTSGATLPLLNGANTWSGVTNFTGTFEIGGTAQTFPASGTIAGTTDTQTLTNKAISGASNTLTNIGNASLTNSSTTVNGTTCTLGSTCTITAAAGGTSGQVQVNSSGALAGITVSGDGSLNTSTGALTVTKTNGTAFGNYATISAGALTNSLAANVALGTVNTYFDGPSVAQGTTGTWFASGTVTLQDNVAAANFYCKLWDGTTVIASAAATGSSASILVPVTLSGYLASPAGNIRISCTDVTDTGGFILFNKSGNSKDSTITAYRIN